MPITVRTSLHAPRRGGRAVTAAVVTALLAACAGEGGGAAADRHVLAEGRLRFAAAPTLGAPVAQTAGDTVRVALGEGTIRVLPAPPSARARARMCGYLASRPIDPMRIPLPADADSAAPRDSLTYVDGAGFSGVRTLLLGDAPRYALAGMTPDGQWVEATFPVAAAAAVDALAQTLEVGPAGAGVAAAAPTDAFPSLVDEPDRAVPDLHQLPDTRILLGPQCPVITIGTRGRARLERILRVAVPAGRRLVVRARSEDGIPVVLAFDVPAVVRGGRESLRPLVEDSIAVTEARDVSVRVTIAPRIKRDPNEAFVLLSLAIR